VEVQLKAAAEGGEEEAGTDTGTEAAKVERKVLGVLRSILLRLRESKDTSECTEAEEEEDGGNGESNEEEEADEKTGSPIFSPSCFVSSTIFAVMPTQACCMGFYACLIQIFNSLQKNFGSLFAQI
jgi:hypothetical protein